MPPERPPERAREVEKKPQKVTEFFQQHIKRINRDREAVIPTEGRKGPLTAKEMERSGFFESERRGFEDLQMLLPAEILDMPITSETKGLWNWVARSIEFGSNDAQISSLNERTKDRASYKNIALMNDRVLALATFIELRLRR